MNVRYYFFISGTLAQHTRPFALRPAAELTSEDDPFEMTACPGSAAGHWTSELRFEMLSNVLNIEISCWIMSNCLMDSAINSDIWAFQTHRSIMRVRLASFCHAKYRIAALHIPAGSGKTRGQKLILHTSECKKISRTQIRFGSSSR